MNGTARTIPKPPDQACILLGGRRTVFFIYFLRMLHNETDRSLSVSPYHRIGEGYQRLDVVVGLKPSYGTCL